MLRDLIEAIEEDRDPFASGRDGRDCLEMIHATWEAHRQEARRIYATHATRTPARTVAKRFLTMESGAFRPLSEMAAFPSKIPVLGSKRCLL